MPLARAIVLQIPIYNSGRLRAVVGRCLAEGVGLIAISGKRAFNLEAEVDLLIIGDGNAPARSICTSAHLSEAGDDGIGDALSLACSFGRTEGEFDQGFLFGQTWLKFRVGKKRDRVKAG